MPQLADVASDLSDSGLQAYVEFDRATASRLGITPAAIDNALYNAFGQRLVSTIFTQSNQYRVVLEVKPEFQRGLAALDELYVTSTVAGQPPQQVPLSSIAHVVERPSSLAINHIGQFPAATISFNLAAGASLGDAVQAIEAVKAEMGMPASVQINFQGAALAFRASLANELLLILAAIVTMYIVLGVLYESFIHPITILSTLPSAGVGALLALMVSGNDLSIIAIIGIILLIGIVKKNAIMMIDFALDAERHDGMAPRDAIFQACLLRFRPIMMTTMAAILGALPLMIGWGEGSELRHPLGIAMVGGLILSQALTLFTTPVIYLAFDRLARRVAARRGTAAPTGGRIGAAAMNLSQPFIDRPVATTLLTLGIALAGAIAFRLLPVSPLPQVDFPTISVQASLPGASPETMAATVATPLERSLGRIAGVTEMTSSSALGTTRITLQFDLSRDIDGAARDVQAAINAARSLLPTGLPSNPTYRKVNPADAPIMILTLTSETMTQGQMYDAASTIVAQKLSQIAGVGQVSVGGSSLPAVRVELNPQALNKYGVGLEQVRAALAAANANRPKGSLEDGDRHWQIYANDQAKTAAEYLPLIVSYRNGNPVQLSDVADVVDSVQDLRNAGMANGKPSVLVIINRQPNANIIETVDRVTALLPALRASIPSAITLTPGDGAHGDDPRLAARRRPRADDLGRAGHPRRVRVPARRARDADSQRGRAGVADRHVRRDVSVRLLDQQLHADGADHRHRLRRRRRDRRPRKHVAPRREGDGAVRRGAAGRARSRVHRAVDEPVADRRVHPDPADGRDRRPAVPRVRGHAVDRDPDLARGVADDHADDVRAAPASGGAAQDRPPRRVERAGLRRACSTSIGRASAGDSRTASS